MGRTAYSTDLTDAQWASIDPFLRAWKAKRPSPSGHAGRYDLREIVNALFYQNRTGCQWMLLPHDLPPWSAVYYYFGLWRDDGTDQVIHDLLRCQVREKAGRVLTVADLADDAVVQVADERGVGRPRPLVAGGALVGLVPGCSVW